MPEIDNNIIMDDISGSLGIVEYLESRNIFPAAVYGDKVKFSCPFPNHSDSTPSFIVYKDEKTEYFHCYGCRKHGTIVHVKAALENETIDNIVRQMATKMNIGYSFLLDKLVTNIQSPDIFQEYDIEDVCWLMSRYVYNFLKRLNFDPLSLEKLENKLKEFDECADRYDVEKSLQIYRNISDIIK